MEKLFVIGSCACALVIGVTLCSISYINENDLTMARLRSLEYRINHYDGAGDGQSVLSQLKKRPGYDDSIVDAWGVDILYIKDDSSDLRKLISAGPDRKYETSDDIVYLFKVNDTGQQMNK